MRRDHEIERLTKYAQGMGLTVTFSNAKSAEAAAEWSLDGTNITIYAREHDSKTDIILSMIHEIAHHLWFIHEKNRKPDLKFEEAIEFEYWRDTSSKKKTAKRFRKRIFEMERDSSFYWEAIYKETDLKIPKWKFLSAMEFDVWQYEVYYHEGQFPKCGRKSDKYKDIRAKHQALKETYG